MEQLRSALGVLILLVLAFALCPKDRRRHVNWRTVGIGLALILVNRVSGLVLPASTKYLIDDVIGGGRETLLWPILAGLVPLMLAMPPDAAAGWTALWLPLGAVMTVVLLLALRRPSSRAWFSED